MHALQLMQAYIRVTHQGQWRQKVAAKLPVSRPRRRVAFRQTFERQRVDVDRRAVHELDVVCGGIFQRHPVFQRRRLYTQRRQRAVF